MQPEQTLLLPMTDGVRIRVHRWGRADRRLPILLVHGFTSYSFWTWIESGASAGLLNAGRQVVAFDLRGHGASDRPDSSAAFRADRMAQDIVEVADGLGLPRYQLAGYSLGGLLGLLAATRDPRVERLALCGCVQQILREQQDGPMAPVVAAAFRATEDATVANPLGRFFRDIALRRGSSLETMALCIESLETDPPDLRHVLGAWEGPSLILGGRQDSWMTGADRLARALAEAACVMVDGDHFTALNDPHFPDALAAFFGADPNPASMGKP